MLIEPSRKRVNLDSNRYMVAASRRVKWPLNVAHRGFLASLLLAVLLTALAVPVCAQIDVPDELTTPPLQVTDDGQRTSIEWSLPGGADQVSAAAISSVSSTLLFGGYELPVEILRFYVVGGRQSSQLVIDEIESVAWDGNLPVAEAQTPPVIDWEPSERLLSKQSELNLPASPIFVHSKGRLRGQDIQVVAISPYFEEDGEIKVALRVEAHLEGVQQVQDSLAELSTIDSVNAASTTGPTYGTAEELAPSNQAALANSVKLTVRERGIQRVTGQQLSSAGLSLPAIDSLELTFNGQSIPLDIRDSNSNGRLDAGEDLRFYALGVGNYWNRDEVYWLSEQGADPQLMSTRNVAPGDAPLRNSALERGVWRNNSDYDPEWPGADGDHWFAQRMTVSPGMQGNTQDYPRLVATPDIVLPTTFGTSTITPSLTLIQQVAEYEFQVTAGETKRVTLRPQDAVGLDSLWEPGVEVNESFSNISLVMIPTDSNGTVMVDSITWAVPVALDFSDGGSWFSGIPGTWRYGLDNLPDNTTLYDITDPSQPVRLTGLNNGTFQDGPTAHDYIVSGNSDTHTPLIEAHQRVVFSANSGADAVYIAPSDFFDELSPLMSHRQSQGYRVEVIDVQDIYDGWGYGHVSPEAIRSFLKFAVQQWRPSPISAVLVSDGTLDPFNYKQKASNVNFIPPYLITSFVDEYGAVKDLDPFWGRNGCENCFGQLDGDDPLNNEVETPGTGFTPDIWIGRFPAKNGADVTAIVNKIIRYETGQNMARNWESEALFLADNYYLADGTTDKAGDFVKFSEDVIALMPDGIRPQRLYYDPTASDTDPYRESNAVEMRARAIEKMDRGPGLVTYNGHSAHWLWARTSDCATPLQPGQACPEEEQNPEPYIFGLYDVDQLTNREQPYIGLSMTCFTSQFFEPANSGTVLDERSFVHPNGGAAAIWGPAGLSVATGHDDLQYGFYQELWRVIDADSEPPRLGQLIEAGYLENQAPDFENRCVDSNGDGVGDSGKCVLCCDDVRRTFLLLGDPLTPVRLAPSNDVFMPIAAR